MSSDDSRKVAGHRGFYLTSLLCLLVSADTSWRFFGEILGITDTGERVAMFAVLEIGLLSCGYGMRANVRTHGGPGMPRFFAWALCAVSAFMALQVSGPGAGLARVLLGPVLGLVMLHLALGIEVRANAEWSGTWARVLAEMRERVLSRLGLGDDRRDALTRTRDRAAARAARLALSKRAPFRTVRLSRALRASGVALDPERRERLLRELATLRHAGQLETLEQASPWTDAPTDRPTMINGTKPQTVIEPLPKARAPRAVAAPIRPQAVRTTRTPRPRSGQSDAELVEAVRELFEETATELGKRDLMRRFGVGSDRALRILREVKSNGEEVG